MEGISHEAASLAGHLGLGKLIALYDSNDISLDGELNLAFSENTAKRFEAYGWQVLRVEEGNNIEKISQAIKQAKETTDKPTLIQVKTIIGYGSPNKSDSHQAHGAPLGKEEASLTKEYYNWDHKPFEVPEEVYEHFKQVIAERGNKVEKEWNQTLANYRSEEHTSELQSRGHLVCRLLLEKKKKKKV